MKERSLRKRKLESLNMHGHKHAAGPARTLEKSGAGEGQRVTGRCGVVAARGKGGDGPRGEGVEWDGTIDRVALVASGSKKSRRAKSDGRGR